MDTSFVGVSDAKRAVSRRCTVESKNAPPKLPPSLGAQPKDCWSKMTRLKVDKLTIEKWQIPNGRPIIEVSCSGGDTTLDRNAFGGQVVKPLMVTHKVCPSSWA